MFVPSRTKLMILSTMFVLTACGEPTWRDLSDVPKKPAKPIAVYSQSSLQKPTEKTATKPERTGPLDLSVPALLNAQPSAFAETYPAVNVRDSRLPNLFVAPPAKQESFKVSGKVQLADEPIMDIDSIEGGEVSVEFKTL